jgi:lipopolysaccharide transport protein LptA
MKRTAFSLLLTVVLAGAALAADESNQPPAATATAVTAAATAASPAESTNEPTVVTSEHLRVDYAHNVGTFEGNVLAVDPRITVRADKMTVFFGSTNIVTGATTNATRSVDRIIAEGAVVITTPENKKSTSERADYTAADGKVILTGHPVVQSPDGVVTGWKITYWRGSKNMDVLSDPSETNRTRLLIYPEEQRKENAQGQ